MAIAGFKVKDFQLASELQKFCLTAAVTTIVSIVYNAASGKYTLFYT
jgi:hypothetical protein